MLPETDLKGRSAPTTPAWAARRRRRSTARRAGTERAPDCSEWTRRSSYLRVPPSFIRCSGTLQLYHALPSHSTISLWVLDNISSLVSGSPMIIGEHSNHLPVTHKDGNIGKVRNGRLDLRAHGNSVEMFGSVETGHRERVICGSM